MTDPGKTGTPCTGCRLRPADVQVRAKGPGNRPEGGAALCRKCLPGALRILEAAGPAWPGDEGNPVVRELERHRNGAEPVLKAPEKPPQPDPPPIGSGERIPAVHGIRGLKRDLAVLDTEWTDGSPETGKMIALGVVRCRPDGTGYKACYTVNPGRRIDPRTTAIHGITDDLVRGLPPIGHYADRIVEDLKGADIGGYNVASDIQILEQDLESCGAYWDPSGANIVDGYHIWRTLEPRTLSDAHRRFSETKRDDETAHDAGGDAVMTVDVIAAAGAGLSAGEIDEITRPGAADPAGRFAYSAEGGSGLELRFAFGKHRGERAADHPDYLRWMLRNDFPKSTRTIAEMVLGGGGGATH